MTASALRHGMIRRRSKRPSTPTNVGLQDGANNFARAPPDEGQKSPGNSANAPGHNKPDKPDKPDKGKGGDTNQGDSGSSTGDTGNSGSGNSGGTSGSSGGTGGGEVGGASPSPSPQSGPSPTSSPSGSGNSGTPGNSGESTSEGSDSSGGSPSSGGSAGSDSSGDRIPNAPNSDPASSGYSPSATTPAANAGDDPARSSSATGVTGALSSSPTIAVSATVPDSGSSTPNPSIAPPNPSTSPNGPSSEGALRHNNNRGAIAGGVIGALFLLFLAFAAWTVYKRRRKNRVAPSAEYLANPAAYPFAHAGFGGITNRSEKGNNNNNNNNNNYGGAGQGAAGQAKFKGLSTDSGEDTFTEKYPPQREVFRNQDLIDPLPPPPQPEILYSTPTHVATPPNMPGATSTPGTPTTPNGRRIPFGTGTFQFPPRPPQPQ